MGVCAYETVRGYERNQMCTCIDSEFKNCLLWIRAAHEREREKKQIYGHMDAVNNENRAKDQVLFLHRISHPTPTTFPQNLIK